MRRRQRRRAGGISLLVALAALAVPSAAAAAQKAIWGPVELPGGGSAFPVYRQLGVDVFQTTLRWALVAPSRPSSPTDPADPAYRWPAEVDAAVAEAARHRIRVALLVTSAPGWANGGRSSEWAPTRPEDFADFLVAAARRYRAVRHWMIWNEPSRTDRFMPGRVGDPTSARAYAPILDASYGALKRVSPRNVVIGGLTWTGGDVKPAPFLRWMRLANGRPPRLDWFGHNPFPFRFPDLGAPTIRGGWRDISDVDVFAREVERTYRRQRPSPRLWLSEFSVQTDKPSRDFRDVVSRPAQARWLAAAYRLADDVPAVAGLGWHALVDEPPAEGSVNWGLMTSAGERKPSFFAFRRAPSRRFRPSVRAARSVGARRLARRGIAIRVRPKASGPVTARLGRRSARGRGRRGRWLVLRLRAAVRRGSHGLRIQAARGETVRRALRVR